MDIYKEIYEFAASAGALEGYVYHRDEIDPRYFGNWIDNLVKQYHTIPEDIREVFQPSLDRTVGRAVLSLVPVLGRDHGHIQKLKSIMMGEMPDSPDDFEKEKKEKADRYGS
jgi:hypothetical protein